MEKNVKAIADILPEIECQTNPSILSGIKDLDEATGGFHKGDLILLCSRPGVGKSTLALNIAGNLMATDVPVLVFSLEINAERYLVRFLERSLEDMDVRSNELKGLSEDRFTAVESRIRELSTKPLYICDTPSIQADELCEVARNAVKEKGIKMIILDYLQLVTAPSLYRGNRERQVEYIMNSLKTTANELDVPMLVLCQLSRTMRNGDLCPTCSDLRESSSLEGVPDVIIMLHQLHDSRGLELAIVKDSHHKEGKIVSGLYREGLLVLKDDYI